MILILINSTFVFAGSILNISWDKNMVKLYEDRYVIVRTTGFSDGTDINVQIWNNNYPLSDDYVDSIQGKIRNNIAILKWGGSNGDDCFLCGYAEYYAKAIVDSIQKKSSDMQFVGNGNINYGSEMDCGGLFEGEGSNQCAQSLYCEGIPDADIAFDDGCCYDYENYNIYYQCNYAIKGQIFQVTTNPNGYFNSNPFPNLNLFFIVYDDTSFLGRIFSLSSMDYIKADSNGNFKYNPEFNRQTAWNTNILFNWKVDVYALDTNNKLIAQWTNSYTNDNDEYKKGLDYIDQRVRIHTDKPYWKDISNSAPIGIATIGSKGISSQSVQATTISDEQQKQIKIISDKIKLDEILFISANENTSLINQSTNNSEMQHTNKFVSTVNQESNVNSTLITTQKAIEEVIYTIWNGTLIVDSEGDYYCRRQEYYTLCV